MKRFLGLFSFLISILIIIFIHELGHFSACVLFGVRAPYFSIGFGPVLISKKIGQTKFQLAAIPLGGYTAINQDDLSKKNIFIKLIISFPGIFFNLIFAFFILFFLFFNQVKSFIPSLLLALQKMKQHLTFEILNLLNDITRKMENKESEDFITSQTTFFLNILSVMSIKLAFFNLLPIPFLDGFQIAKDIF